MATQEARLEQLAACGDERALLDFFSQQGFSPEDLQRALGGDIESTVQAKLTAKPSANGAAVDKASHTLMAGTAGGLLLVAGPRVQAVFVLTTSTLILRTGVMPKWLAYFGYVMGLALFITPLIIQPIGLLQHLHNPAERDPLVGFNRPIGEIVEQPLQLLGS